MTCRDLVFLGTFPRTSEHAGLRVFVPSARYMLALKLKPLRVSKYDKGRADLADVASLLGVLGISDADEASAILTEFFPNSPADVDRHNSC